MLINAGDSASLLTLLTCLVTALEPTGIGDFIVPAWCGAAPDRREDKS